MTTTTDPAPKALPAAAVAAGMASPMLVEAVIDLAELNLAHAPGNSCGCGGRHVARVTIDLAGNDLHDGGDCDDWDDAPAVGGTDTDDALQALHEKAHPDGTVFVAYCREPECVTLRGVLV